MENNKIKYVLFFINVIFFLIILNISLSNKYAIKNIQILNKQKSIKKFHMKLALDKNINVEIKKDTPLELYDCIIQKIQYLDLSYSEH